MAEEYRKQHIVPRSYLYRFAVRKGDTHIIGVRLKPTGKQDIKLFSNSVYNVGYIENYYDTLAKEDKKFWEHYLDENFDRLCGTPLSNIVSQITLASTGKKVLTDADKMLLAKIIMSQMIRVPAYLDKQMDVSKDFLSSCANELVELLPVGKQEKTRLINAVEFNEDSRKNVILEGVFDKERFNKFCKVLVSRTWIIYYNTISNVMPFVTSDNPVLVKSLNFQKTGLGTNGIGTDNTVVFYPITPTIMIGIYSPNLLLGSIQKYDSQREAIDDIKFIGNINIEIIENCYKHAFLPEPLYKELNPDDRRYQRIED